MVGGRTHLFSRTQHKAARVFCWHLLVYEVHCAPLFILDAFTVHKPNDQMKVKGREGQNHRGLKTNMDSARLFVFFWERRFIWDRKEGCKLNVLPVDELLGVDDISTVLMREKPSWEPVYPNHGSQDVLPLVKLPSLVARHFRCHCQKPSWYCLELPRDAGSYREIYAP